LRVASGVAAFVVFAAAPAAASPWNRADGALFISTRVDYFVSKTLANEYQRLDTDTYLEWGATPRLMLGGKAIYGQSWTEDSASVAQEGSITEAAIFAQRQISRSASHAFAVKLAAGTEGADIAGGRTGVTNASEFIDARLLYGRDISPAPLKLFATAEAGFRKRFDDLPDQWRAEAQFGIEPTDRILILLGAEAILSAGGADLAPGDYDLAKAGVSLVFKATRRMRVSAGARKEFGLRDISDGRGFHIGLWTEF
jgi:hypothetical protein